MKHNTKDKAWRPGRILIIRFGAIGDVVLATALVRQIKRAFPNVELEFLVKSRYAGLLKHNPHLSRVWAFESGADSRIIHELRGRGYDGLVDLQDNARSRIFSYLVPARRRARVHIERGRRFLLVRFHRNLYRQVRAVPDKYLDAVRSWGVTDDGKGLELFSDAEADARVSRLLAEAGISSDKKVLALAPGAGRATKRWPAERFAETSVHFHRAGYAVVLIGGDGDACVCDEVAAKTPDAFLNFCGKLQIEETVSLIRRSALLVANDTGVMHIATAVGCPVVTLFGPTTRHFGFFPFRGRHAVVERELGCRPCGFHGTARCPKNHFRCMREIAAETVIRSAETLLNTMDGT